MCFCSRGDLARALESYRASLQIDQRLAESDPSNAAWQREMSVSHNGVGNVLLQQGDLPGAKSPTNGRWSFASVLPPRIRRTRSGSET